jgi:transcriptional regulator with XRE-family HTH domain
MRGIIRNKVIACRSHRSPIAKMPGPPRARSSVDPVLETLGKRVRALREEQKLSLRQLAKRSGFGAVSSLSEFERGRIQPALKKIGLVADALGVDLSLLFQNTPDLTDKTDVLIRRLGRLSPGEIETRYRRTIDAVGDPTKLGAHAGIASASDPVLALVGWRIRQLRRDQRKTLTKLARASRFGAVSSLSEFENGLVQPALKKLGQVARRLRVDLPLLFLHATDDHAHKVGQWLIGFVRLSTGEVKARYEKTIEAASQDVLSNHPPWRPQERSPRSRQVEEARRVRVVGKVVGRTRRKTKAG